MILSVILVVTTNATSSSPETPSAVKGVKTYPSPTSQNVRDTANYAPLPPGGGDQAAGSQNRGVYS